MCIPSNSLCRVELRRPEVKIFRNSRFRPDRRNARLSAVPSPFLPSLVRKSPLRNYVRKKNGRFSSIFECRFLVGNTSRTFPGSVLLLAEIKIFRNGRSRAVRSTGGRPVTGQKYGKIGSLFRHPFFIRDPSGTFPGLVPRRLEVPIFRNGELRAVRSTGGRPVTGPKIGKIGSLFGYPFII